VTWGELTLRIRRAAGWLRSQGVGPAAVVALQQPKCLAFLELHLAALAIGAITLPLNDRYTPAEVQWMLTDSGARLAVVPADSASGTGVPSIPPAQVRALLDAAEPDPLDASIDLEQTGVICYTSGTTGRPKGARLRQRNVLATVEALHQAWQWRPGDVLIHALPLFHVHGLFVAAHGALRAGAHAIWLDRFSPEAALDAIERHRATVFMGVPTFYHRLLQQDLSTRDVSSVRLFTSGSAPLPARNHRAFEQATGHRIVERYGMTEVGIVLSNPLDGPRKPGSIGRPLPGVMARVVDPQTRHVQPTGDVGEVEIRGPSVFEGYHRQPRATADAIVDGWMRTGDLGRTDTEGYYHLVGRQSELVITGGLNVYPAEVEAALGDHPQVSEVAVFGVPDDDLGEQVRAAVVASGLLRAEALAAWARERLAPFKQPRQVHFVDALPRNSMGKVLKPALRERFGVG